jgi:hypothetical protein
MVELRIRIPTHRILHDNKKKLIRTDLKELYLVKEKPKQNWPARRHPPVLPPGVVTLSPIKDQSSLSLPTFL